MIIFAAAKNNMELTNRKKIINKVKTSVALIIVAAALIEIINVAQYFYTRNTIREQSIAQAYDDLNEIQRVVNLKTSVETAVQNAMGDVEMNLSDPDKLYGIATRLVMRNSEIIGSSVSMAPHFYPQKERLFAPYAFQDERADEPRTKVLPYDYTQQEWFTHPFKSDSAYWSEPYYDTGGANLLIYTYGLPIHNKKGKVVGVLTADVYFKELVNDDIAAYEAYEDMHRMHLWVLIFQLLGIFLIIYIVWRYSREFRRVNKLIMSQEIMGRELKIASDIQEAMLPNVSSGENARHHLDLQVKVLSAPDVGADFYDYIYSGQCIVFCIGDVPGSNVKASLTMSITRSAFRTAASIHCGSCPPGEDPSPAAIMNAMNHALCSINHNEMFVTMFIGVLNLDSARFGYCCAGNPAPVVLNPSTGAKLLDTVPNVPVGVVDDYKYEEQKITMIDDFTLFLYNDGLYETENSYHEIFGIKRMMARLDSAARMGESPEKILSKMQDTLESYRGSAQQEDDITMLAMKII